MTDLDDKLTLLETKTNFYKLPHKLLQIEFLYSLLHKNYLSYDVKFCFPPQIENTFFELLLPNTKPIFNQDLKVITRILSWRSCFQSLV